MITVIIPASGNGQRFKDAGYIEPKPLIPVKGVPMLKRVVQTIKPSAYCKVVVISRAEHNLKLHNLLNITGISTVPIELDQPTQGAVDTILKAKELISDEPLLIANCDQIVKFDVNKFIETAKDGVIATFSSTKPHHSYVKTDVEGVVTEIAEKEVISGKAVTGIYYFRHGTDFLKAAEKVLADDKRVKGEFYVSTVLDQMIQDGKKLTTYQAPTAILGTSEELQLFEDHLAVGEIL